MSHHPQSLRVLLVDDQALFRRALASLIGGQLDMTVVGEAEDGGEALEKVRTLHPDLVVMDVQMPRVDGVGGVRAIRQAGFDTKIVMLTVSEDDEHLFESIKAGANGYLLKNVRPEVLFEDLRGVMRGEAPIAPGIANKLLDALRTGGVPTPRHADEDDGVDDQLTPRETEILELVAEGLSNKEIAARLHITEGTVKNHVHNALERLHLSNRTQAAAFVVRHGRPITREPGPTGGTE